MSEIYRFFAEDEDKGERLDLFLVKVLTDTLENERQASRSMIQRLISDEKVLVNGLPGDKSYRINPKDEITALIPEPESLLVKARDIPIDVVYEDKNLIIVNKPKGMVVHPAVGHESGTLVNALLYHCKDSLSGINGVKRPGIVHRIDKDTSGLIVVAKNDNAHILLAKQLFEHTVNREYRAVCHGAFKQENGKIELNISRDKKDRKKFSVSEKGGKSAITEYSLIKNYAKYSDVSLKLHTGRTHQIRVHLAHIGHAVAGDIVYGPKTTPKELNGQCLHAKTLGFINPETGRYMHFDSDLPLYYTDFLSKIG